MMRIEITNKAQSTILRRFVKSCFYALILITVLFQFSCKKYLDKKPSQDLAVPSTLADLQAVLDNQIVNNFGAQFLEVVADNYYVTTATWNNLSEDIRKTYIWDKDARITVENATWSNPYQAVYKSNFVLDLLPNIKFSESERGSYNNIKGFALFNRAFMFHELAQLYCRPYSTTAGSDPGIVLRKTSQIDQPVSRSTVQETYDQIIADLKEAVDLLPVQGQYNTRPNRAAAYGLLARVYLSMRDYNNALVNATASLNLKNTLLDYNDLNPAGSVPVNPLNNPEILYLSVNYPQVFTSAHTALVDSVLYQSYNDNDWRKTTFYGVSGGKAYWRGSYYASGADYGIFDGVVTDEVLLTQAECKARAGDANGAMDGLNSLLRKRWKTGTFSDLTASSSQDALNKVLTERRKELAFRGSRWSDLRRLNLDGANITLTRIVNGTTYTLPPNDLRWVLLIPEQEINRSGIQQNAR
jgi:starch-binding outer membrane protein, SusD/RagB family